MTAPFDLHTHSRNSHDSTEPFEAMCQAAIAAGLGGIALTDHLDLGPETTPNWPDMLTASVAEATEAAERHRPHLKVLRGVEIGEPICDIEAANGILRQYELDIVLLGMHSADRHHDLCRQDHAAMDPDEMLTNYFSELLAMAEWDGYNVLAHIGYPLRYVLRDRGVTWSLDNFSAEIDAVLSLVAETGRALEVNTAGPNRGTGELTADVKQLRRFKELGGRYVTLGSDAHAAKFVGGCFDMGLSIIKEAGFEYLTHFENRRPVLSRI